MKNLLILGAGRSATTLIQYILAQSSQYGFQITVADADVEAARRKIAGHPNGRAVYLDAGDEAERRALIGQSDVVVSLLPPTMHPEVAEDCLALGKHLATASYVTKSMQVLHEEARRSGLTFMNEIGLDPGIDHMSAMQRIHQIEAEGGKITGFYSSTGGLIAPESDDNPWHYKFSWNPRNVVLAGQGVAQFLEDGKLRFIPYRRLFQQIRPIEIPGLGQWEVYANRDSLQYREAYGLQQIATLFRGTIRHRGFCAAWDALIQLGMTESHFNIPHSEQLSYSELVQALLGPVAEAEKGRDARTRTARLLDAAPDSEVMRQLDWLGLFSEKPIGLKDATPALILEQLLLEKWALKPEDKDMIIMQHIFEYERADGQKRRLTSTLVTKGENGTDTAMARLVGLPLGIFVKLLMLDQVSVPGVQIPLMPAVYEPVLAELATLGVQFVEEDQPAA